MPEDEAIDFTFTLGVDTAFRVAQSMSEESTLKKDRIYINIKKYGKTRFNLSKLFAFVFKREIIREGIKRA
jgi:hypothetical protein